MKPVIETCKPRPEILAGTFNPEIFTASLSPVIEFYRTGRGTIDSIYTNAKLFFGEATHPTQGLKSTLSEVFARITGDTTVPAIHRLETAFGGGKTHTLIACTHIAHKGMELSEVLKDIMDKKYLPEPGSVAVVGIAGDEIPVHKTKGDSLVPYTLWGEIAYQIGGEGLYQEIGEDATSHAAPGKTYFTKVLSNKKVLIMLDELAQYAARLEAARPDGASQLAAFLMSLHGHARNNPGIAILLTLASASDAFSRQTELLAKLIGNVRGQDISEDDALGIGERAVKGVSSVVARDAVQVTPVQSGEISSVLAKRLFVHINKTEAQLAAEEYMNMYRRNTLMLPDEASSDDYKGRMISNYPFHPTLVDFLNKKLAEAENFQGTRGVLRVLSLAVRSLWQNQSKVPMIHTCHLDLRSERVVNEILGRTSSSDLLLVLNTDIGSVDTGSLEGGRSNAELADQRNPHPEGYPLYEYAWKTVFLHSLVGREEGVSSKIFGITESDTLFSVAFPRMTPPQVRTAVEEINESAFYLRYEQGKYFASEQPTINSVLARIRKTLNSGQIKDLLDATARKIVSGSSGLFHIEHDVSLPEHMPDGKNRPCLGVVSFGADTIDVEAIVTTKGINRPREQQNLIFLLVPETVSIKENLEHEGLMFDTSAQEIRQRIESIAKQVKAMRVLLENPTSYGVNPRRLENDDFRKRYAEREQALLTSVAGAYSRLYFSSTTGTIVRKEIKTAGGEGGTPFMELIRESLLNDSELLTARNAMDHIYNLAKLFFDNGDTVSLQQLRINFSNIRTWPVLESQALLDQIIRTGVQKGSWCVYRLDPLGGTVPKEFYSVDEGIPMGINLNEAGYGIVTTQGANQRGWVGKQKPDQEEVKGKVLYTIGQSGASTVDKVMETIKSEQDEIKLTEIDEALVNLLKGEKVYVYRGDIDQQEKPDLIHGAKAALYTPQPGDIVITRQEAMRRGWFEQKGSLILKGRDGAEVFLPLLKLLGSMYNKGAKSKLDYLEISELLLPGNAKLRISVEDASPETVKALGEFFEVVDGIANTDIADVFVEIKEPDEECLLIKELKKTIGGI